MINENSDKCKLPQAAIYLNLIGFKELKTEIDRLVKVLSDIFYDMFLPFLFPFLLCAHTACLHIRLQFVRFNFRGTL